MKQQVTYSEGVRAAIRREIRTGIILSLEVVVLSGLSALLLYWGMR